MNRREFLRRTAAGAAMAAAGAWLPGCAPPDSVQQGLFGQPKRGPLPPVGEGSRKLVIVLFGGGLRSSEAIDDPRHRWVPRLWNELVPRGTLLDNMRVEGKVVHPNSAGSIMTGHWEWADEGSLDWSQPVAHPTLFEIYRKARLPSGLPSGLPSRPDTDAWAFVYASILANIACSKSADFGPNFAANVVEPPTIPRSTAEQMDLLFRQAATQPDGCPGGQSDAARRAAELVRATSRINLAGLRSTAARELVESFYAKWKGGQPGSGQRAATTSHDAFLAELAIAAMNRFAPTVLAVCFGEIDCAHYGSWSRYVEAIQRTDELTWRLWRATEELPAYRDRTMVLILPDHGRELERPGGPGFIHHSDFYTDTGADEGCRRVWMLAVGPGVTAGRRTGKATPITTVAATGLRYLGLTASDGAAPAII